MGWFPIMNSLVVPTWYKRLRMRNVVRACCETEPSTCAV
jgi:hypothetical protein